LTSDAFDGDGGEQANWREKRFLLKLLQNKRVPGEITKPNFAHSLITQVFMIRFQDIVPRSCANQVTRNFPIDYWGVLYGNH
jgi:hypothetical protein